MKVEFRDFLTSIQTPYKPHFEPYYKKKEGFGMGPIL